MSSPGNNQLKAHIIPRTGQPWQRLLAEAFTDPKQLLQFLQIEPSSLPFSLNAAGEFGLLVPRGFAGRMEKGNPADPLLRQVLPVAAELVDNPGFSTDPVGDAAALLATGVLQKYQGRLLLITTGACAVHCRYCFRQHYPYRDASAASNGWLEALHRLRTDPSITEVILSGGDPLMLPDAVLAGLIRELDGVPHLVRMRIHTRMPIVLPERIVPELISLLAESRLQTILVVHCNHPQELSPEVSTALQQLRQAGITLLNQAVLLRGVNDRTETLCELSEALFTNGVLPYYLHVLDRVAGAAHFALPAEQIRRLGREISERLPGYLAPRLVYEQAGAAAKLPYWYQSTEPDPASDRQQP
jgi:EF-P beta-lysylation protein EpmB